MSEKIEVVQATVTALNRNLTDFLTARAAIMADPRLSDQGRREKVLSLRDAAYSVAVGQVQRLWGKVGKDGFLAGGSVWAMLEAARDALQRARDSADPLDPATVDLASRRLSSVLRRCQTLDDLAEWYNTQATSAEKRALQLESTLVLSKWPDAYGFVNSLERDLQADLETPEVVAAQRALEVADRVALAAVSATRRAADVFGDVPFLGGGIGPFSTVLAGIARDGMGRWQKQQNLSVKFAADAEAMLKQPKRPDTDGETDEEKRRRLFGG